MTSHRFLIVALAAAAVLSFLACSGKRADPAAGSVPPGAVLYEVDLGKSVANLQQLKSFSFDLNLALDLPRPATGASGNPLGAALLGALSNVIATGSYVAPDRMQLSMKLLGQDWQVVVIGQKAWTKVGGAWQEVDLGPLARFSSPPELLGGVLPADVLKVATTSRERINGVDTVRYSFSKTDIETLARDLAGGVDFARLDEASLDLWLNADGVPVRMAVDPAGKTEDGQKVAAKLTMNVTHINDPSIEVKPPA